MSDKEIAHGYAVYVYDDGTIEVMDLDAWSVHRNSRVTRAESASDAGEEIGSRIERALQADKEQAARWEQDDRDDCEECDPSLPCFNNAAPCAKVPQS